MGGDGETWILLPSRGVLTIFPKPRSLMRGEWSYFYDNFSFTLSEAGINVSYPFEYASLIEGSEAVFLSPLIFLDNEVKGKIIVRIRGVERVLELIPKPSEIMEENGVEILSYTLPMEKRRIWIRYRLVDWRESRETDVGHFILVSPPPYEAKLHEVLVKLEEVRPKLSEFFGFNLTGIKFKFYVPSGLEDVGGFVRVEEGDAVNLNLMMLRYIPGYLEVVALHELLHHYIWRAGMEPDLTWFHEGAATFLSIHFLKDSGLEGVERYWRKVEARSRGFADLNFVLSWRGGAERPGYYYSAAYRIFSEINSSLGIEVLSKFFHTAHFRGLRIRDNGEALKLLVEVSGGEAEETLARMGIILGRAGEVEEAVVQEDKGFEDYLVRNLKALAVILSTALFIEMAILILRAVRDDKKTGYGGDQPEKNRVG